MKYIKTNLRVSRENEVNVAPSLLIRSILQLQLFRTEIVINYLLNLTQTSDLRKSINLAHNFTIKTINRFRKGK